MSGGNLIIRNYSDHDFNRYVAFHVEAEQLDPRGRYVSAQTLQDDLQHPRFKPQTDLWLADLNGKLVGSLAATREPEIGRALLDGCIHPQYRRRGIASKLLNATMKQIRASGIESAQVSILDTNTGAKKLLKNLGFAFIRYFVEMQLRLGGKKLQPSIIGVDDISGRPLKPHETRLLTDVQNRCFAGTWGFSPNTEEEIAYRLNMKGRSPQDVTLTFMNDLPIGYCWAIVNAEENESRGKKKGMIHMLGVDPDYRQKDIGKIILQNGLADLRARGVDMVQLTVDYENPAACSLYESVGFTVYAKTEWYEKPVISY
jgi:mycothiol synthase